MKDVKKVWVLTDAEETDSVYAELDVKTLNSIAAKVFSIVEDEDDPDAPKNEAELVSRMVSDLEASEDGRIDMCQYSLISVELADGNSHPDFKVEKGCKIFELAERVIMGCDMSYALSPVCYRLERVDDPALTGYEWIEWTVE